jgi:LemA protein
LIKGENEIMKKGLIVLLVILLIIVFIASWFIGRYNTIQKEKVTVETAWAQVENVYQSRYDLVPNLVATVQGAANFERETLTQVTEARAQMGGQINLPPEALSDPNAFQQFQANQAGLSSALSRLMVVVERYPELKANQNFLQLQAQLEGVENRIRTERMRYNDAAKLYNQMIVVFPNNIIAGMINARAFQFFSADAEAQRAPQVQFE